MVRGLWLERADHAVRGSFYRRLLGGQGILPSVDRICVG